MSRNRTVRVGELDAGEKIIIKNQLFELQKRLNILDLESRLREEENAQLTFSPQIPEYPLDRDGDFLTNIQKSEQARLKRLEQLRKQRERELQNEHTFAPKISTKSVELAANVNGSGPIHERLIQYGEMSQQIAERRREHYTNYDEEGRKLYEPRVQKTATTRADGSTAPVDVYLYQDAFIRKDRQEYLEKQAAEEAKKITSQSKMCSGSKVLVRKKEEDRLQAIFTWLASTDPTTSTLSFEDVANMVEFLQRKKRVFGVRTFVAASNAVWRVMGANERGEVTLTAFRAFMKSYTHLGGANPSADEETQLAQIFVHEIQSEFGGQYDSPTRKRPPQNSPAKTARPAKNSSSSGASTTSVWNFEQRAQELVRQKQETERQLEAKRQQQEQEQLKECTFKPTINPSSLAAIGFRDREPASAFERLYSKRNEVPRALEIHEPSWESEQAECTFTPDLISESSRPGSEILEVRGYENSVSRLRAAASQRELLAEKMTKSNYTNESYERSRQLAAQGPKPFQLQSEKRSDDRKRRKVRLHMQVNVGKSRTGRLTVADGDDPIELATRFAQIYRLNASATAMLAEAIQANMQRHRIRVSSSKSHAADLSSIGTQSEADMLDLSAYVNMDLPSQCADGEVDTIVDHDVIAELNNERAQGSPLRVMGKQERELERSTESSFSQEMVSVYDEGSTFASSARSASIQDTIDVAALLVNSVDSHSDNFHGIKIANNLPSSSFTRS